MYDALNTAKKHHNGGNIMSAKGIVKGIVTAAVICGLGAGGWALYKHYGGTQTARTGKVYVQKVATMNTVDGANLFATNFAGVIVAQKTVDVKYDTTKQVEEILVHEGDAVKKGDKLLTYNVEQIQLDIESAELEIERLQNQIKTNEMEIGTLEQERRNANGDAQVSYTTKILSLQSDNARSEYDIKTKNVEITKLKNSLNNAFVTAQIDGTVKDLKERRRDISPVIRGDLIDLVQEHQRVRHACLAHRIGDPARHRADIRLSVAADLRLIVNAAEADPYIPLSVPVPFDAILLLYSLLGFLLFFPFPFKSISAFSGAENWKFIHKFRNFIKDFKNL